MPLWARQRLSAGRPAVHSAGRQGLATALNGGNWIYERTIGPMQVLTAPLSSCTSSGRARLAPNRLLCSLWYCTRCNIPDDPVPCRSLVDSVDPVDSLPYIASL